MPMFLPPISRRRFLAGSLAAGAGMLLPRWLRAGEDQADPHRWVLLSDTHVCEDRDKVHRGVKPVANFAKARNGVLALRSRPAGAIVAGDCAFMQGNPGDYELLVEEFKPLRESGLPIHLALGNHDDRSRFDKAFPAAQPGAKPRPAPEPPADRHVAILETPRANWFLLDSLRSTNRTPGELGQEQLAWLAKSLDARPDKPALVLAHHDPDKTLLGTGLLDATRLFEVLAPRKHVKAYVFGHTHRWELSKQDGIHLINLPACSWVFNEKQPHAWVEARLVADGVTLVLHSLDASHAQDGEKVSLKWRT